MKLNNSNKSLLSFISAVIFVFAAGLGVAEARYASIVVDAKRVGENTEHCGRTSWKKS